MASVYKHVSCDRAICHLYKIAFIGVFLIDCILVNWSILKLALLPHGKTECLDAISKTQAEYINECFYVSSMLQVQKLNVGDCASVLCQR